MKCESCDSEVDDEAAKCPHCGYYPRRSLLASGISYTVLGYVLVFGAIGLLFASLAIDIEILILVSFVVILVGMPVGFLLALYGLSLAFGGRHATVDADLDAHLLPVLW